MSQLWVPGRGMPSRRHVLSAAMLSGVSLAGAGLLGGCSRAASADVTPVQLWHLFTGGDGGVFQAMMDTVDSQNPGLEIDPVVLTWGGPYYTKLAMSSVGGRSPDLAVMHATRVVGYAPGGLLDTWDMGRLAEHGVTPDMFPPALWNTCVVDGEHVAVPLDFHAFLMFYNTDLCDHAGLLDPDGRLSGLDSPEALIDAGRALAKVTGDKGISFGYTGDGAQVSRMWWGLYYQTGATATLVPGQEAVLDRDKAIRVTQFVADMLDGEVADPDMDYGGAIASFSTGRTGITFMGNWELQSFLKAGITFDAMTMPNIFGTPATFGDCHVFVLPHQDRVDETRRDAAYQVVAGMLKNSLDWAAGGHTPANLEVTRSSEYAELVPQAHYANAMEEAVFEPSSWFTGSGSDFQARVAEVMQSCWLSGSVDAEGAVDGLIERLNTMLAQNPPA
ncbi:MULTISPECIES: extracellular solute-binding protein [Actinomyces]|uniref:Extracellular solute-binding protein n=1 Tax=Actinomyces respiraculi TaxID=2744574 RepID=A0A7T0PV91_9ACTO|nr:MULTISPECIES: extracellular solute-binding protein [Actinomyces]QPL05061.1 extracellular solute-binding protein [Actinomyces respiraculi]